MPLLAYIMSCFTVSFMDLSYFFFSKISNLLNDSCGVIRVASLIHVNDGVLKKMNWSFLGIHPYITVSTQLQFTKRSINCHHSTVSFTHPKTGEESIQNKGCIRMRSCIHCQSGWDQGVIIDLLTQKLCRKISKTFLLTCKILSSFLSSVMNRV